MLLRSVGGYTSHSFLHQFSFRFRRIHDFEQLPRIMGYSVKLDFRLDITVEIERYNSLCPRLLLSSGFHHVCKSFASDVIDHVEFHSEHSLIHQLSQVQFQYSHHIRLKSLEADRSPFCSDQFIQSCLHLFFRQFRYVFSSIILLRYRSLGASVYEFPRARRRPLTAAFI